MLSSRGHAIGEEEADVELGEAMVLAAYREMEGDPIRTVDVTNGEELQRIIDENQLVLLLK